MHFSIAIICLPPPGGFRYARKQPRTAIGCWREPATHEGKTGRSVNPHIFNSSGFSTIKSLNSRADFFSLLVPRVTCMIASPSVP